MSLYLGNKAALSLTFDDALPCQLENAIPIMDEYGIRGTFFAITDCPDYPLDVWGWRKVALAGHHEIGSHSAHHKKAADLSLEEAKYEAAESKRALENHFGIEISSFCYPYTDAPSPLQQAVQQAGYKQARGGRVARSDKYIEAKDRINLYNVPCYHISNCVVESEIYELIDLALHRRAWLTFMFHAIGDHLGWDNVSLENFMELMKYLKKAQNNGLWVTTFGEAAENQRASK